MSIHLRFVVRGLLGLVMVAIFMVVLAGPAHAATRWNASYWNNMTLSGPPALQRVELSSPNFNWGQGSPLPGVIQDNQFSARWQTSAYFDPGRYRFTAKSDDGVRVWVGTDLIIDEWHDASGQTYTADFDVTIAASMTIVIDYFENKGDASIATSWERIGGAAQTGPTKAEYFNNMTLQGQPALVRDENEVIHNWGQGSPAPGIINNDHFSARYTRTLNLAAGTYRFTARADDGIRLWINGQLVIDQWYDSPATPLSVELDLPAGVHHFVAAYYENVGLAEVAITGTQLNSGSGGSGSGGGTGSGITATVDTSYLNLRSGPGTNFSVIEVLSRNTLVELTGDQESYWVEVVTPDGTVGWVSNRYLDYNLTFRTS
ncbi:MAG: PA14 domain-containing protein [Candidatus Promineifilaceae bacterium]|nr:PA14 domain-containing protein [Candidatus Promineifilaceae bacterium]